MSAQRIPVLALILLLVAAVAPAASAGSMLDMPGMSTAKKATGEGSDTEEPEATPASADTASTDPSPSPTPEAEEDTIAGVPMPDPLDDPNPAAEESAPSELQVVYRVHYAGARTTRSIGSLRDCPSAPTCAAYEVGRARWPVDATGRATIPYRYNDAGRPSRAPSSATVKAAVDASAAEWNRWNSNVRFTDGGATSASYGSAGENGSCDDGVNVIGWRPLSPGAIGVTRICYDPRTYELRDADLALNSTLSWASFSGPTPGAVAHDVQAIVTHELGHFLSLFDLRFRFHNAQTMYGSSGPGETRKRTLALGDVVGSQTAYPCGSGDVCPRTGIVDD